MSTTRKKTTTTSGRPGRPPTDGETRSRAVMLRLTDAEGTALAEVAAAEQRKPGELGRMIVASDPRIAAAMRRAARSAR